VVLFSETVRSPKGYSEFSFDGLIFDQAEPDRNKVFQGMIVPLLESFQKGGNISLVSYGQKGLKKSDYLSETKKGVIKECLRYLTAEGRRDIYEISVVRVSSNNVRRR
jgi:hypothetical protein